jgi:nitrite reductase/ring-hydroxylating ferredoxin subunit
MSEVFACNSADMKEGGTLILRIGEVELGLMRHKGNVHCYRNVCPHQGGPACEGIRMPGVVDLIDSSGCFVGQRYDEDDMRLVCPWHGYEFRLESGVNVGDPRLRLRKFEVLEKEGEIYVVL